MWAFYVRVQQQLIKRINVKRYGYYSNVLLFNIEETFLSNEVYIDPLVLHTTYSRRM